MNLTAVLASEAAINSSCVQVASVHEVSVCGGVEGIRRPCGDVMQKVQSTMDAPLVQHIETTVNVQL